MIVRLWHPTIGCLTRTTLLCFQLFYNYEVSKDEDKVLMTNTEEVLQDNVLSFFSKAVYSMRRLLPSFQPCLLSALCTCPCEESHDHLSLLFIAYSFYLQIHVPGVICLVINLEYLTAIYVLQFKFRVSSSFLLPLLPPPPYSSCLPPHTMRCPLCSGDLSSWSIP